LTNLVAQREEALSPARPTIPERVVYTDVVDLTP